VFYRQRRLAAADAVAALSTLVRSVAEWRDAPEARSPGRPSRGFYRYQAELAAAVMFRALTGRHPSPEDRGRILRALEG
jgi:hypothetical protein